MSCTTPSTIECGGTGRGRRATGVEPVPEVGVEALERYDVPAPRYTSYPTVPQFEEISDTEVRSALAAEAPTVRPLSLYFHIPYCQQLCWYCGCNRIISKDRSDGEGYVDLLVQELERRLPLIGGRRVEQMHLGGGTPTFLPASELLRLGEAVREAFEFSESPEIALEIDPRECTREQVDVLREVGFNRASIGVQDHDPEVQEAIHRRQPYELTRRVVEWLRSARFESVNFDLIYGLPRQTPESFRQTLEDVVELRPDRLAVYSYAHVPWKHPAQKLLEDSGLPDARTKLQLLKCAIDVLTDAGYVYIGLDHFARPDDELARALNAGTLRRNFQGYSTHGGTDIHAFGLSGISQTQTMYVQNTKEMTEYRSGVAESGLPVERGCELSRDDRIRREVIERIMCGRDLEFSELSLRFDIDFPEYFSEELAALEPLEEDGLVERNDEGLRVTPRGRLFLRNVASRFDAYLEDEREKFSKTV